MSRCQSGLGGRGAALFGRRGINRDTQRARPCPHDTASDALTDILNQSHQALGRQSNAKVNRLFNPTLRRPSTVMADAPETRADNAALCAIDSTANKKDKVKPTVASRPKRKHEQAEVVDPTREVIDVSSDSDSNKPPQPRKRSKKSDKTAAAGEAAHTRKHYHETTVDADQPRQLTTGPSRDRCAGLDGIDRHSPIGQSTLLPARGPRPPLTPAPKARQLVDDVVRDKVTPREHQLIDNMVRDKQLVDKMVNEAMIPWYKRDFS